VQINALEVYAIPERMMGQELLQQGDAVLPREEPHVMALCGRQHDL
jgi:hypothetical protein